MTQRVPLRLSDAASDATPELRAAVRSARGDGPNAEQLQRLMSGVIAQLPAPRAGAQDASPQTADAGSTAAAGKALHALRWLILVAIGAVTVLVLNRALRPAPTPVATPDATAAIPDKPAAAPAQAEQAAQLDPPVQSAVVARPAPEAAVRATPAHSRMRRPAATVSDPGAEIALLQQARRALASAPDRTLMLLQSHARLFPDSVFREEREALAVEALLALGRRDEAKARAHALLERYPQSAYRRRIERLFSGAGGRG